MSLVRRLLAALALLSICIGAVQAAVSAQGPATLEPVWSYALFGDLVGHRSMQACDLGSDGRVEFLFEDGDCLVLVGWPEGSDEPHVLSRSHSFAVNVSDTAVWFDGAEWRVAVLFSDDSIAVLELPSFEIVASGDAAFNAARVYAADLMNGPEHELILTGYDRSAVYDSTTIDELLPLAMTGTSLAAGNVDGDPATELVFNGGEVVEIRNGFPILEWTVPTTGDRVLLAELDGSPPLEIVMGDNGNSVAAYSFGNPTTRWGYADDSLTLIGAADLTRDGRQEVIVVGGWDDELMGLHPALGLPIWAEDYSSEYCEPDTSSVIPIAGDLDGDGYLELFWSSGDYSGRRLCAADAWSGEFRWKSEHHEGPVHAIGSGDLEGDGTIERLAAVSGTLVAVFDAGHPTPRSVISLWGNPGYPYQNQINAIATGDVDRDGVVEVVLGTGGNDGGAVLEFDPTTREYERGASDMFNEVTVVDIADLDGDAWPEIAIGGEEASGLFIGALEGATAELEWWVSAPGQGQSVQGMLVGEVDGDPALEIVAIGSDDYELQAGSVIIVDADTSTVRWSPVLEFYGLDLADLDDDGIDEILTGSETGELVALEAVGAIEELWRIPVAPTRLVGIRSYRDHLDRLVVAVSTEEALIGVDLATAEVIWVTPILGEDVGTYGALDRMEIPGEETPALLVGTRYSIQEIRPGDLMVFGDGFESGGTSFWSVTLP